MSAFTDFDSNLLLPTTVLTFCFVIALAASYYRKIPKALYPPGPKGKFIIGNALDIPKERPWLTYMEWEKRFKSDMDHINVFGNHIFILNKLPDVMELFEKRSQIYSDRPVIPMMTLMEWDFNSALLPYGDKWRVHRKLYQQNFRQNAVAMFQPTQTLEVHDMLRSLVKTPQKLWEINMVASIAITMSSFVVLAEKANELGARYLNPGSTIVNILPCLTHLPPWFPGAGFHHLGAEVKALTHDMQYWPMEYVKREMAEGTARPSLVSELLDAKGEHESEQDITQVAGTIYGAASDTTIASTEAFFYAMVTHPEIQKRAQEEIDRVIGTDHLPQYEDRDSLPYIEAIYREIMRFRPPLCLGLAHRLIEDGICRGYTLPKGSIVFPNIWAMTHDESVYSDPGVFRPERFFDDNGKLNSDSGILAFGFGRRKCVGRYMGSSTVWLMIVSILAVFRISKAKDEHGNDIPVEHEFMDGTISHPKPFPCAIVPRTEKHRRLVQQTAEEKHLQ